MPGEKSVLVVGGGIAGIQAALDLGEAGFRVYLVEREPVIGGKMAMLSRTFPTNDCALCILSPKLVECGRHPRIEVLTRAELVGVEGAPGDLRARVLLHPRGVKTEDCRACGDCAAQCPVAVDDEFNQGLAYRRAVYQPYPQAYPPAYVVDWEACIECEGCTALCAAVDRAREPVVLDLQVGAVILAPGCGLVDPLALKAYRYREYYPSVLTGLEFERLLSVSGPYRGRPVHPATEEPLGRVAWVLCAGSREPADHRGYCSAVCCMYALKQALAALEQSGGRLEATLFYTDLRTYDKGAERYYRHARQAGIRFVRSRITEIKKAGPRLRLRYGEPGGRLAEEEFDLVVLAVGFTAPAPDGTGRLPVARDAYGFYRVLPFTGVATDRPGILVAGAARGPKAIPAAVLEGSAAAGAAAALLGRPEAATPSEPPPAPPEPADTRTPRVGLVVCRCGGNIGQVVDTEKVVAHGRSLPGVVEAREFTYACARDSLEAIRGLALRHRLNRVVVAACSPRTHRPVFQAALSEIGINPSLVEMTNIREQCSWVHSLDPGAATAKAADLVRLAVARVSAAQPVRELSVPVTPACLVVGGGVAGMVAALDLAGAGYEVHLVEKTAALGGRARRIFWGHRGEDVRSWLRDLTEKVEAHPLISLYLGDEVAAVEGGAGNFTTTLRSGRAVRHGAVVLATGASEAAPEAAGYARTDRVRTLTEVGECLARNEPPVAHARAVAFVLCAGSRTEDRPYCSRVCCGQAVRLALEFKKRRPDTAVSVLYRDMMTYGLLEDCYREARQRGVQFLRFEEDRPPAVEDTGETVRVTVVDPTLGSPLVLEADLVGLACAVVPNGDAEELARLFRVPRDEYGFFQEAHLKLRPVDFAGTGLFMCGLAHGPKSIEESVVQARAAAARAATVLSKPVLRTASSYARVDAARCSACLTCVRVCPYGAPRVRGNRSAVDPVACQGCGMCAAECPARAIELAGREYGSWLAMFGADASAAKFFDLIWLTKRTGIGPPPSEGGNNKWSVR